MFCLFTSIPMEKVVKVRKGTVDSEQAAAMGMFYPDEESQTIETPPTLLHHDAAFAKNTTTAGLLNQLKHTGSAPLN